MSEETFLPPEENQERYQGETRRLSFRCVCNKGNGPGQRVGLDGEKMGETNKSITVEHKILI